MDFVNCTGSEFNLWDCHHFTHSYSGCDRSHDAGVRCQPGGYHPHIENTFLNMLPARIYRKHGSYTSRENVQEHFQPYRIVPTCLYRTHV